MRKVYICSPYRAKDGAELDRNIDYAQQLTRQALEAGLAPITPHLYMTQCMDDKKPEERARGMAAGLALLKGSLFLYVLILSVLYAGVITAQSIQLFFILAAYIYLAHCLYLLASKFSISEMQFDGISS